MASSKIILDGYRPGDSLSFQNVKAYGRLVNARNAAYVEFNLPKPIAANVSAAVITITSGYIYVAGQNSKQIPANPTVEVVSFSKNLGLIGMTIAVSEAFSNVDIALADNLSGTIQFT